MGHCKKKKNKIFPHVTKRCITTNKNVWNKGFFENNDITLIDENKVITSERELAKTFNEHYTNIVEKSSEIKPKDIFQRYKNHNIQETIKETVKSYENHHSISQIGNICSSSLIVKKKFWFLFLNDIKIKKTYTRIKF